MNAIRGDVGHRLRRWLVGSRRLLGSNAVPVSADAGHTGREPFEPGPYLIRDEAARPLNLYLRPDAAHHAYSDGDAVEQKIAAIVEAAADLSTNSAELSARIDDWPTEYHFSRLRGNVIAPFRIQPGTRVLELGCGCGAVTRALGERGAEVVAVEGSPRRARIAASRCRDLPNVRVIVDSIAGLPIDARFDLVVMVGVLEYAPRFFDGPDPIRQCLEHVKRWVAPTGSLIVAIENQLGLKYLNGHEEDHVGRPFWGIEGLYRRNEAWTLGRRALAELLQRSGFPEVRFFYPFPDYKLPRVVISEQALAAPDFHVAPLLSATPSRSYCRQRKVAFDEVLVWEQLEANGLIGDLSHAFLIQAGGPRQRQLVENEWLATYYTDRPAISSTETTFRRLPTGIQVVKSFRDPNVPGREPARIDQKPFVRDYIPGGLHQLDLRRRLARGEGVDSLVEWARPWIDYLKSHAWPPPGFPDENLSDWRLPGNYIDCVPFNLVTESHGRLAAIDDEWHASSDIPLGWVALRGLVYSLTQSIWPAHFEGVSFRQIIFPLGAALGLTWHDRNLVEATTWERVLAARVQGKPFEQSGFEGFEIMLDYLIQSDTRRIAED